MVVETDSLAVNANAWRFKQAADSYPQVGRAGSAEEQVDMEIMTTVGGAKPRGRT